jgi:hypothetical protein
MTVIARPRTALSHQIKANENGVNGSANEHMNRDRSYFDKVARPF